MKQFISLDTQFIGYRNTIDNLKCWPFYYLYFSRNDLSCCNTSTMFPLPEALAKANKRADNLASKLEKSEKAREKAEQDAASVGDLRKRLHQAETALSENISQQTAREEDFIGRLESQNRRFVSKLTNPFLQIPSKISSSFIC
jgi:septal ring factor EnvC (AmiA/AmiB activator)